jgi:hypothetical protein
LLLPVNILLVGQPVQHGKNKKGKLHRKEKEKVKLTTCRGHVVYAEKTKFTKQNKNMKLEPVSEFSQVTEYKVQI